MKVITHRLHNPVLRRSVLKLTFKRKGKNRAMHVTLELGTILPGGSVRWTNYTKLKKQLTNKQQEEVTGLAKEITIQNLAQR